MSTDSNYYGHFFPVQEVGRFLKRHSQRPDKYREIGMRWLIEGKVTWQRFNSFGKPEHMIADIQRRKPNAVYVGPTYNTDPTLRWVLGKERLHPVEQRLVFDVDLTDYDDLRTCECVAKTSGLRVCEKCWPLAAIAVIVLRNLLRYKFGFHEFLCTFSGNKGVHCWVLDQQVLSYTDETRLNISEYFRPFMKGIYTHCVPLQLCPVLEQCYEQVVKPLFEQHILGRVISFRTEHGQSLLHKVVQSHQHSPDFLQQLPSIPDELELWRHIESKLREYTSEHVVRAVVMMCTFPRIDKDITTTMQHLIRCPFTVNGRGGRVCVPIRYQDALEFAPELAPTASTIKDSLSDYLEILEEALVAPWCKLWVCRVCENSTNVENYKPANIFHSQKEWKQHHEDVPHGRSHSAENSTAKAIALELDVNATTSFKQTIYTSLLRIKL